MRLSAKQSAFPDLVARDRAAIAAMHQRLPTPPQEILPPLERCRAEIGLYWDGRSLGRPFKTMSRGGVSYRVE